MGKRSLGVMKLEGKLQITKGGAPVAGESFDKEYKVQAALQQHGLSSRNARKLVQSASPPPKISR